MAHQRALRRADIDHGGRRRHSRGRAHIHRMTRRSSDHLARRGDLLGAGPDGSNHADDRPVALLALRGQAGLPRWLGALGWVAFPDRASGNHHAGQQPPISRERGQIGGIA